MKRVLLILLLTSSIFAQSNLQKMLKQVQTPQYAGTYNGSNQYASVTPNLKILTGETSLVQTSINTSGAYACNQIYGKWAFTVNKALDGDTISVHFISDLGTTTGNSGYLFRYGSDNKMYIYSRAAGTNTARITSSGTYASGSNHTVEIKRNTNGDFTLTADGASVGTVNNATYTTCNYSYFKVTSSFDYVTALTYTYGMGSLDLNSYERIKKSWNRAFEIDSTLAWANNGSYTFARSTITPITGTASFRGIIGSGDATTNNISLPYANFVTLVNGQKTTLEFNVRDSSYTSGDSVYCKIGDKTKGIAFTDANIKKFVFNFQNTASTINQNMIVWFKFASGTRTMKIDDYSLTQAKDALIILWDKPTVTNVSQWNGILNSATTEIRIGFMNSSATPIFRVFDFNSAIAPTSGNLSTTNYNSLVHLINRTGNASCWTNGVSGTEVDATPIGKLFTTVLRLGSAIGAAYFNGQIGEITILTFDDIAASNVSTMIPLLYQAGYQGKLSYDARSIKGGGVDINAWYKWSGNNSSDFLKDYSSYGNNLTGTNFTQSANQIRSINLYRK